MQWMIYCVFCEASLLGTNLHCLIRRILINEISAIWMCQSRMMWNWWFILMFFFILFYSSFKYVLVGDYDSPFCWNIVFGILCIRLGFEPYQFDPFFFKYNHSSKSKHYDGYWAYTYSSLSVILSDNIFGVVVGEAIWGCWISPWVERQVQFQL